ncbi:hypothetical protein [[Eubacterium] hominis]|uniref:hypothetical protein n=1 Tax=[Eubacterium] hominis TaxID=2764325 RepID=UPI003A4D8E80
MEFTYTEYRNLLELLKSKGYKFESFDNDSDEKTVICRHDVDMSLECTLSTARIEKELNIKAIYFVLLSTNFYNIFSPESRNIIYALKKMGHEIGLHFDASVYPNVKNEGLEIMIMNEIKILEILLGQKVNVVSFHRPIRELFNKRLNSGLISAYEEKYFSEYKYVSDSRRNWRKNPYEIINENPNHIQLLTHPFWYSTDVNKSAMDAVERLKIEINNTIEKSLENNITDYHQLMKGE